MGTNRKGPNRALVQGGEFTNGTGLIKKGKGAKGKGQREQSMDVINFPMNEWGY